MQLRTNERGQTALEYAMVVAVVIIALVAMQGLVKKSLQGRNLQSAKQISEDFFEPSPTAEFHTGSDYQTSRFDQTFGKDEGTHLAGDSLSTIVGGEQNVRTEFVKTSDKVTGISQTDTTTYLTDGVFTDLKTENGTAYKPATNP